MVRPLVWIAAFAQLSNALRRSARRKVNIAKHLSICDDYLVSKACAAFTEQQGTHSASASDLSDALVVTESSINAFLLKLGFDEQEVSCKDLCLRTAQSLPEERMPPASNLGCHMSGSEKVCDFDLSSEGLGAVAQTANPHRFLDKNASDGGFERPVARPTVAQWPKVPVQEPHEASFSHLQEEVAHWFGIWLVLEEEGPSARGLTAMANCGPTEGSGCTGNGGASNQKEIDRLTLAYLAETEMQVRSGCANLLQKWFGESSSSLKNLVIGGLQFLTNTIKNPFYVNWEDYGGYWGWVYPGETVDGKLVIHLAKSYFNGGMADRVGTITHEAAHHPPLRRRDVAHRRRDGPKQYCDVPGCLELARTEKDQAQLNDDNWSFFIDDLVGGGMNNNAGKGSKCSGGGGGGSPSPPAPNTPSPPTSERRRRRRRRS